MILWVEKGKEKDGEGDLFAFAVKNDVSTSAKRKKSTKEDAGVNSSADVEKSADADMSMESLIGN
ncbi:hypothetical protein D4T97_008365 [Siminovitchia acidinfaciens]|uniref:Uncharacterized protein n=2 Tax=Siminovitchia acidinfaciens TaxID=2321395 RepID=A0A429Y214_9BACI|nr:hypothetical protein D4T97_008365 [Siminovitchia acidinfaciens]